MFRIDVSKPLLLAVILAASCSSPETATPTQASTALPSETPVAPTEPNELSFNPDTDLACVFMHLPWMVPVNGDGLEAVNGHVLGCVSINQESGEIVAAETGMSPATSSNVRRGPTDEYGQPSVIYSSNTLTTGNTATLTRDGLFGLVKLVTDKSTGFYDSRTEAAIDEYIAHIYKYHVAPGAKLSNGEHFNGPVIVPNR